MVKITPCQIPSTQYLSTSAKFPIPPSTGGISLPLNVNWKTLLTGQIITDKVTCFWWLGRWISKRETPGSKPLGNSEVDSFFHPSKVHQIST